MNDENKPQGNSDWLATYELNLVDEVSCDTEGCSYPAMYFARVSCCKAVVIACTGCMRAVGKTLVSLIHQQKTVRCTGCGKDNDPRNWMSQPEKL